MTILHSIPWKLNKTIKQKSLKKELLIIGGGLAGFWSAISAIRQSREIKKRDMVNITLINPDNIVTIHPTLNHESLVGLSFEMDRYFVPLGVHQIFGRVLQIFPNANQVVIDVGNNHQVVNYDYLILASGATIKLPKIKGIHKSFKLDSFKSALKLENHLIGLARKAHKQEGDNTILVIGSEFKGLEIAVQIQQLAHMLSINLPNKKDLFKIILIDEENQLASKFSKHCRVYIEEMISYQNINVRLNSSIKTIDSHGVFLSNGDHISSKTVIWTKGLMANFLTTFFEGSRDSFNRLMVNSYLKLPEYPNVIAAGNVAHLIKNSQNDLILDCQYAQFEGRWAGNNAINDLFDIPLKNYERLDHFPCVDLGAPPQISSDNFDAEVQNKIYNQFSKERYINNTTIFPWQDIEATVSGSYPELIIKN
tara:strand:+ start:68100 stop:69368 length:1269 start_codon:yes stop_codon:yes gene_type:complete